MTFIKALTVHGYRGFAEPRTLKPAIPDRSTPGSGLTVLVGPNNSGKSSITEALIAVAQRQPPSFHVGQRNVACKSEVRIALEDVDGSTRTLRTVAGGSSTQFEGKVPGLRAYSVPARRQFASSFGLGTHDRAQYEQATQLQPVRQQTIPLHARLQHIVNNAEEKRKFDDILAELMAYRPAWTVEQYETGSHYVKYTVGEHSHSSDGLGDGIISLFSIAAAIYDPEDNSIIIIDEPELSLHPQFQRRVLRKLISCAANYQVLVTTHSPLFINWQAIADGAQVVRVVRYDDGIQLHSISDTSRASIRGLLNDINNPHVLGLDASEIFFYEDGVILVEGQEDVILLPKVADQLGTSIRHPIFGWGVGGADKMHIVARLLRDLGFKRVSGIIDKDKACVLKSLRKEFPEFNFVLLPADDVRTKQPMTKAAKTGVLDEKYKVRAELEKPVRRLLDDINLYLDPS